MFQMTPRMYQMAQRIVLGLIVIACLVFLWIGYRWYRTSHEERAHNTFAHAVDVYEQIKGVSGDAKKSLVDRARDVLTQGHKQFKNSAYGPLFLVYLSQLELEEASGKPAAEASAAVKQAQDLLAEALKNISSGTPLHRLYAIKAALVMLDSDDEKVRAEGQKQIESWTQGTTATPLRDMALFYAGKTKFDALDYDGAAKFWNVLINEYGSGGAADVSGWATRAQELKDYRIS